jgi:hypothetical protein
MAVHCVVEQLAGIGQLVSHIQPSRFQHRNGDARGAVVLIIKHADFPRALLIRVGREAGREAVHREDEGARNGGDLPRDLGMIGLVESRQPGGMVGMFVAGDDMPVGNVGNDVEDSLLAVEITHQARDATEDRGAAEALGEQCAHFCRADVERDMLGQQLRGDAEIDVLRHMVRGMIGDDQDRRVAMPDALKGGVHRSTLAQVHQPGCIVAISACASSRSAMLSNSAKQVAPEPDMRTRLAVPMSSNM